MLLECDGGLSGYKRVKKEPIGNLTKTAIVFAIRLIYSNFAE